MTVGVDAPDKMADGARAFAQAKAIKLKLAGETELDRERVAPCARPGLTSGWASTPTRVSPRRPSPR